jgi:hypothetical protein
VIHVLREFGHQLQHPPGKRPLLEQLREPASPELRLILSDGRRLFFSLGQPGAPTRLFGGVALDQLASSDGSDAAAIKTSAKPHESQSWASFGEPEGSEFARLELSVNAVARSLELD